MKPAGLAACSLGREPNLLHTSRCLHKGEVDRPDLPFEETDVSSKGTLTDPRLTDWIPHRRQPNRDVCKRLGASPRSQTSPVIQIAPGGATAVFSEVTCRRPSGALETIGRLRPGAGAPGYMPAPLRGAQQLPRHSLGARSSVLARTSSTAEEHASGQTSPACLRP